MFDRESFAEGSLMTTAFVLEERRGTKEGVGWLGSPVVGWSGGRVVGRPREAGCARWRNAGGADPSVCRER